MSRWREGFPSSRKKPAPEHGIRIKKAGTTWWGKRWIEALELVLRGDSGRLARGKTYARAGRVHDLSVHAGKVTASVTGSSTKPYKITIALSQLDESAWHAAIAGMAAKAQFSAQLLAGQMPQDIDDVFVAASVSLFPRQRSELHTSCSCPDWGDPCKHVAATHYVLGEALDRDPFLLFELRGRNKEQVLSALRAARTGQDSVPEPAAESGTPQISSVTLTELSADDYDRPQEPLPALSFDFEPTASPGAVLRQLGTPPAWQAEAEPAELLAPLVRSAADAARRIALGDFSADDAAPSSAADAARREDVPAGESALSSVVDRREARGSKSPRPPPRSARKRKPR
jgi:uncharacterized Zn finger protein